jgi:hypothetical protein
MLATGGGVFLANVAVGISSAFSDSAQVDAVPEQPSPRALNKFPVAGVSVRTIEVPDTKLAEQAPGQAIPAGELATEPLPVTATVNVKDCGSI